MENLNTPSDISYISAPDCADISPSELGAFIRAAIIRVWVYVSEMPLRPGVMRGRLSCLRGLLASLFEAELEEYHAVLRGALMNDPLWQASVREDLGGERTMTAWQTRFDKAQDALESTENSDAKESLPQVCSQTKRNSGGVKTDRDGLFRMEIIPRAAKHDGLSKPSAKPRRTSSLRRKRPSRKFRLPLTPLRAEELRAAAADIGRAVLSRMDIAKWGKAIIHEQVLWAQRLKGDVYRAVPCWGQVKAPP